MIYFPLVDTPKRIGELNKETKYSWFPILAKNPNKGIDCSHIKEGYLKYHVGKHYIYYLNSPAGIEIIRNLHQSMDAKRHF